MTNKKSILRLLSFILVTSMLMASCLVFASCDKNNNGTGNQTTTVTEADTSALESEEETESEADTATESDVVVEETDTDADSTSDTSANETADVTDGDSSNDADATTVDGESNATTDGESDSDTETSEGETTTNVSGETTNEATGEVTSEATSEAESKTEPETTTAVETTTTAEETTNKPEETTEAYTGEPYVHAEVGEVIITKVYGNDGNADAPIKASFIELYNTTDKYVSLGNHSLYYGEGKSFTRLKFGEYTVIAPNSYFLIKCNEINNYTGTELLRVDNYDLEWGVKIDNKEFELVLAPNDTTVTPAADFRVERGISSYMVASLTYNVDIYEIHDLSKNKVVVRNGIKGTDGYSLVNVTKSSEYNLKKITPKSSSGANSYVKSNYVEVSFSQEGGVFTRAFTLNLTAPEGYVIYYTLNGKDPMPMRGTKYTDSGIKISNTNAVAVGPVAKVANTRSGIGSVNMNDTRTGGIVVKAMAISPNGDMTAVFTQTYFVSSKLANADAMIISLSLDQDKFIGTENGAYYTYQFDLWGTRPRSRAFMEVFDRNGVKQGGSYIEFAVSGNGSSGISMKSLRLYYKDPEKTNDPAPDSLEFNPFGDWAQNIYGQNIETFDRVLIRNAGNDYGHTFIRDAFVQRMAYGTNVDSMAYAPAIVYVNGEIWGVYNFRQRYSPEYFSAKYGVLEENVSLIENESPLKNDSSKPESWNNDYVATAGDEKYAKEFNDLVMYIRANDLSKADVYKYVTDRIDVDSFIDYIIYETYFYNNDWPGNNIKVWKNVNPDDPSGMDTKWRFVLLDMDHCLGYASVNSATSNFFPGIGDNTRCGSVFVGLMENPEFKLKFASRAFELVDNVFYADNAISILNDMAAERRALLEFQYSAWLNCGSTSSYDSQIEVMRSFLRNRAANYKSYVLSYTGLKENQLVPQGMGYIEVATDSTKYTVSIDGATLRDDKKFTFEEKTTFKVSAMAKSGFEVFAIIYINSNGDMIRYNGSSANIAVTSTGRFVICTRATSASAILSVTSGITAGMKSVFYVTPDGDLYAWGDNTGGALGGGTGDVYKPIYIMSGVAKVETTRGFDIEAEKTNLYSTAVLMTDGTLYTVGGNGSGQLGRGGVTNTLKKVDFAGTIIDVKLGQDFILILDSNKELWGMGNNARGQLGAGGYGGNVTSLQSVAKGVTSFAAGRRTTAYVNSRGDLYVLGDNRWNKTHTGSTDNMTTAKKIASNIKSVGAGEHSLLIIDNNDTLYYLGWKRFDTFEQTESQAAMPNGVMYKVLDNVKEAEMQDHHIIALTNNGDVYGYGLNTYGQMANNGASILKTAKKICSGAADIAAGSGFTTILLTNGKIVTYGANDKGQAGTGSTSATVNGVETAIGQFIEGK